MLELALAVVIPYVTAALLGATLGKLKLVGPLLRGVWYTTFWVAVIAQIAAVVTIAIAFFVTPIRPQVAGGMVAASTATATLSLLLALVMFPVSRKGHGEEDAPTVEGGTPAPLDFPAFSMGGEGMLAVIVIVVCFAVSFFPLRGVVRVTSRVLYMGILHA